MNEPSPTTQTGNPCSPPEAAEKRARWSPYVVGAGLGVLSWVVFAVVNQPLGISTALSSASSVCALPVMGAEAVAKNAYWTKHALKLDYGMLFLAGTFLGSLASVLVSRSFRLEKSPAVWRDRFGASTAGRWAAAFAGGVIVMYGARMAGGCTSGHGISGSLQLALSSWVFFLTMFASGVVAAWLVFRRPGRGAH